MIALDTNILVYGHRRDSTWHEAAAALIRGLAEEPAPWAIPWPCLHEFLAIVTHPRIYSPPSTLDQAVDQVEAWRSSSSLVFIGEDIEYWPELSKLLTAGRVSGPMVHDARVASICSRHAIAELWSADRDFGRFPGLKVRNPLVP